MQALVSTPWLADQLASPDLLVCDATLYLPGDPRDAQAAFCAARIPGARRFDLDLIADIDSALPHMLPATSRFERLMGQLGVSAHSRVVFYDQLGLFSAARAWWMLRAFGHQASAVLDGGLPKWRREGRPTQAGAPGEVTAVTYQAAPCARWVRGVGDVLNNLASGEEIVLDARSRERFEARSPEPRPGVRGGHIPGARNLPFTELLTPEQTLLPSAALRARFALAGVTADSHVVTSCGSGLTAAILTLGLVAAGLPAGALYDGSWTEWGGRTDTPIATGAA